MWYTVDSPLSPIGGLSYRNSLKSENPDKAWAPGGMLAPGGDTKVSVGFRENTDPRNRDYRYWEDISPQRPPIDRGNRN